MSDSESEDELERIRARKRERLREQLEGDATAEASGVPDEPVEIAGEDDLGERVGSAPVVLVDFYADWCGPCRMLAPTLETIAADTPALVAKVDTEAHPSLTRRYGVQGLPTLLLFVDGEPVDRLVGMQDETTLRNAIERHAPST